MLSDYLKKRAERREELARQILRNLRGFGRSPWDVTELAGSRNPRKVSKGQVRSAIRWLHKKLYIRHKDFRRTWNAADVTAIGHGWLDRD